MDRLGERLGRIEHKLNLMLVSAIILWAMTLAILVKLYVRDTTTQRGSFIAVTDL